VAVLEKDQMLNLAKKTVDMALRCGAKEAEAYVYEGQTTNVGIERGQITKSQRIIDRGLGLRVIVN
jgi:PmbA protein